MTNATEASTQRGKLFAVKLVHTAIFASLSWAVLYTFYSGITGRVSRKTGVAVVAVLGEAVIFAGNGFRCPLTKVAESLGAENGTVGDIFLPAWFARRLPQISSTIMAIGLLGMLYHRVRAQQERRCAPSRPNAGSPA